MSEKTISVEKLIPNDIVDVDDCDSIDQPLNKTFGGITKWLRSRSGQAVPSASVPAKITRKTTGIGPKKGWSKAVVPIVNKKKNLKRKDVPSSDSEYHV
ncbi:hypothetical protein A2U01_0072847, partial [Trifolium medium]|nr:hypothetical protein [Trifolium medium]